MQSVLYTIYIYLNNIYASICIHSLIIEYCQVFHHTNY